MSLEHKLKRLQSTCRMQTAVIGCGLLVALGLSGWRIRASRDTDVTLTGRPHSRSYDTLAVRHLMVENDNGEVVTTLSANEDGLGYFQMYTNGTPLFSVLIDDDKPIIRMKNSQGKTGITLGLHEDARGKLYVFNSQEQLCAGITADDSDSGAVFTANAKGDVLALMGRGKDDVGAVVVFGQDDERVDLSTRSD